ncbi:MAG: hypothetical protein JWM11_1235, partial [Planctomycetaceae bacterium]|nr:hypothetical protein [Planctomycetaceae bacterium]
KALTEISGMKTLKSLFVRDNRISLDKVAELRAKLPNVEIQ